MNFCLKCGKNTGSTDFYCPACQHFSDEEMQKELEQDGGGKSLGFWDRLKGSRKRKALFALLFALALGLGLGPALGLNLAEISSLPWPAPGEEEKAEARIITVPGDHSTIQEAINAASHGDIVEVEPGIYRENITFGGKNILLRSTDPDDSDTVISTVIEGGESGPAVVFKSGEGEGAVLKGFTVTGTSGAASNGEFFPGNDKRESSWKGCGGGGILITGGSSPTVKQNIVTGIDLTRGPCGKNSAGAGIFIYKASPSIVGNTIGGNRSHQGGGIYIHDASPALLDNLITENEALWDGGGIYVKGDAPASIENNLLEDNRAENGGGIFLSGASTYIRYNRLVDNQVSHMGGGLYLEGNTRAAVSGNLFAGNHAGECGGGLVVRESAPRVAANTFRDNSAGWRGGGGVYIFAGSTPRLINNAWQGNSAPEGAAIWVSSDSFPDFATSPGGKADQDEDGDRDKGDLDEKGTGELQEEDVYFQE